MLHRIRCLVAFVIAAPMLLAAACTRNDVESLVIEQSETLPVSGEHDPPENNVPGPGPGTGAGAPDSRLVLHWDDLLQSVCTATTPCRTDWVDPEHPHLGMPGNLAITAGTGVGFAHDPRITVMIDVQRDVHGDGTWAQRGLVMLYDAAANELVDHPDLPDDFVELGISEYYSHFWFLSIIDVDGDGLAEMVNGAPPSNLLRWNTASHQFEGDRNYERSTPVDLRSVPGSVIGVVDIDNDGLLDIETYLSPHTAQGWGPVLTRVQAGKNYWESVSLYLSPSGDAWDVGISGIGSLWDAPGAPPLRLTPGDGAHGVEAFGSCWSPSTARVGEGYTAWNICDIDARPGGHTGALNSMTPMGVSAGMHDLNRDGQHEILVTTTDRTLNVLTSDHAFDAVPTFDDYGGWMTSRHPSACDPAHPIVPDADGVGWTCTEVRKGATILPWGTEGVDIDNDGWRDVVMANGEDGGARLECATTGMLCVRQSPMGVWRNTGDDDTNWVDFIQMPKLEWWPLADSTGNSPPIGNYNGLRAFNLDGDSDVDYLVAGTGGDMPAVYAEHTQHDNNGFCLRGVGTVSNHLGIGSFVEVHTNDGVQHFQVGGSSGPGNWALPDLCIGIAKETVATVVWAWPSGYVQTIIDVPAFPANTQGAVHTVTEPRWLTIVRDDGAESSRREPPGSTLTVTACSYDTAPLPLGTEPTITTTLSDALLEKRDFRGSTSTIAPNGAAPGCASWQLQSKTYGVTQLSISLNGVTQPINPRIWWFPHN